jgi:quercetin dioxygenase-like cupin family protein
VIVKEGTLEVNIDGRKQAVGSGAMIFFAANENENLTNIGQSPATYYVLQWFTPLTPKN